MRQNPGPHQHHICSRANEWSDRSVKFSCEGQSGIGKAVATAVGLDWAVVSREVDGGNELLVASEKSPYTNVCPAD